MSLMGELINQLVRRRSEGCAAMEIRMAPRAWDRILSEVGEQDGLIESDGHSRSFLKTPVVLDETTPEFEVR